MKLKASIAVACATQVTYRLVRQLGLTAAETWLGGAGVRRGLNRVRAG